jgi:putative DNA primase/helicase
MGFREIAHEMTRRGVAVVPTLPGLRHPALSEWPRLATTDAAEVDAWANSGYGSHNCCCVAKFGGVFFLDIDDLAAAQKLGIPALPSTLTVSTPGGGFHYYYRHTPETEALGNTRNVIADSKKIVELKGHNSAVAAPGCVREDGGDYRIVRDVAISYLSGEVIQWVAEQSKTKRVASKTRSRLHPEFDVQELMKHYGWSFADEFEKGGATYYIFDQCPIAGRTHEGQVASRKSCLIVGNALAFNCKSCGDEYGWKELVEHMEQEEDIGKFPGYIYADEDIATLLAGVDDASDSSIEIDGTGPKGTPTEVDDFLYHHTDTGNAEHLVSAYGDQIRYLQEKSEWRVWDAKRWSLDYRGTLHRMAKDIARGLYARAGRLNDEEARKAGIRWALQSEGRDRRNAMIELAGKEASVRSRLCDYDADPWLFNVQNGTIDLRTQTLREHSPSDMITKISPVIFDPPAACPLWDSFLGEIMEGDRAMIDFLARAAGYSLSGDTSIQAMFFLFGEGANGKSVMVEVLRHIIGEYSSSTAFDTFVVQKHESGVRTDLADLVGARFVTASESTDGHRLNEALIKSLTGGEPIKTRFLYQNPFEYKPQYKIWMSSNYKPGIRGLDWGIWRRVKLIPFEKIIPENRRDSALALKLKAEAPGILNWMLRGLADYLKNGMAYPVKVSAATQQYRNSQDIIGQFIDALCVVDDCATARMSDLYAEYKKWAEAGREYIIKERLFSDGMKRRPGITIKRKKNGQWYLGVGLITPKDEFSSDDRT